MWHKKTGTTGRWLLGARELAKMKGITGKHNTGIWRQLPGLPPMTVMGLSVPCVCRGRTPSDATVMGLSVQNSSDFGFRSIVLRKHTIWWLNFKMILCLLLWWTDWAWGRAAGDLENNAPESIFISEFIGLHRRNSRWLHSSLIHFGNLKYLQILKNTLTTGLEE